MSSKFKLRKIGLATEHVRGTGIWIPGAGGTSAGGGEYGAEIIDNARTFAITREPIAHRVVFTVAHDVFDNWFELELEGDEEGTKSKKFDKAVQDELTRLKAKQELALMAVYERAYGYSILVLGYEETGDFDLADPVAAAPKGLREIKAYAKTQIGRVDCDKDKESSRYGLPLYYNIKRPGIAAYMKVHYSRVIHFATRRKYEANKNEWEGMSVLDPIWDDVVTLRNIRWSMGQTMFRYGSGFPKITLTGADKTKLENYRDSGAFENITARTYFLGNETQDIEFVGTAGRALDPLNYYLPPMEHISAGTGIPLAILRGVQAGALTGSEVNQMEYYGLISDEQTAYEPGIRQLIDAILKVGLPNGEAKQSRDYKFNWLGGFELDELKKADVELKTAQVLQMKGQWHTINEIRKMEDPSLTDLPEGERLLGAPSFSPFEEQGEKFRVTPHVDGSSTVTKMKKRR